MPNPEANYLLSDLLAYLDKTDRLTAQQLKNLEILERIFGKTEQWQAADNSLTQLIAGNTYHANLYCERLCAPGYILVVRNSGRAALLSSIEYSVTPRGYMLHVPEVEEQFWPFGESSLELASLPSVQPAAPLQPSNLIGSTPPFDIHRAPHER